MMRAKPIKQPGKAMERIQTGQTRGAWGAGRSYQHSSTRARILARDQYVCQCHDCKVGGRLEIATEVDHIDNRRGRTYEDDGNRMAINKQCHKRKTELERLIGRGLAIRPEWMDRTTWGMPL